MNQGVCTLWWSCCLLAHDAISFLSYHALGIEHIKVKYGMIKWRSGPFKVFGALMKPSWMHCLTYFEGRHCPASRPIWKDVMGVPWDSLLDIAWDVLAPVRVSRNRERRGCFSFNVRHFQQTDCLLVHDFLLLFIHVWKWFGHSVRWSWRRFRQAKATTCVWHFVGNS